MAYWMKDVLQDLEHFCERNRLGRIKESLRDAEKILDEEIRAREDKLLHAPVRIAKTGT